MDSFNELLFNSIKVFVHRLADFIPNILIMFLVVLIGVVLSTVARFLLLWFLRLIKFDGMAENYGISQVLTKGGIKSTPSRIVSSASYWGILTVFFMMGFVALDIVPINNLISEVFSYIPILISAVLIVIVGIILGRIAERAVFIAAENAEISQADLVGKGVKFFIVVMTIFMALDQLGIGRGIIIAAFSIFFGGIVFAVSLAFGLGGKDMAREFLEKRLKRKDNLMPVERTE